MVVRWARFAVTASVMAGVCVVGGSASAGGGAAPNQGVFRPFAPEYMDRTGPRTAAEAVSDARHFDVLDAKGTTYTPYVAAMRRANPRLVLLAYMDTTMVSSSTAYPASWYLHDASGAYVRSVMFGNYAMDPANPGWVTSRQRACRTLISQTGYDGCLLDVIGPSVVNNSGFTSGVPINPRTGTGYTSNDWMRDTGAIGDAVRSAVGSGHPVYGNNIGDGAAYFDPTAPTSQLVAHFDGVQTEGFLRLGRAPLPNSYPTEAEWLADVNEVASVGAAGKPLLVITKTWSTGSAAVKAGWQRFAAASFLLVADGSQRFCFTVDLSVSPATYYKWYDAAIGTPTASYTRGNNGVYRRVFTGGRVYVNPTAAPIKQPLRGVFVDVTTGSTVDGTLTVPAHGGVILRG